MAELSRGHLLVVGGTGFIGRHVVKEAINRGIKTTSFSLSEPNLDSVCDGANYLSGGINDTDSLRFLTKTHFDYVVNSSGYINHADFENGGNVAFDAHFTAVRILTRTISTEKLKRFIQLGSSDEYGSASAPQMEDMREDPISPYSAGKVCATHYLQTLAKTDNYPSVILRLFLTYGPGQDDGRFLPQIIKGCRSKRGFPVSAGEQLRDFCHVSDTVSAIFSCLENEASVGELFNVGSGNPVTIRHMIESVVRIVGEGAPEYGKVPYRLGESMSLYPDISKIKGVLGWAPKVTLNDGLTDVVNWFSGKSW